MLPVGWGGWRCSAAGEYIRPCCSVLRAGPCCCTLHTAGLERRRSHCSLESVAGPRRPTHRHHHNNAPAHTDHWGTVAIPTRGHCCNAHQCWAPHCTNGASVAGCSRQYIHFALCILIGNNDIYFEILRTVYRTFFKALSGGFPLKQV